MNRIALQLKWEDEDIKLPQSSSQVWSLDDSLCYAMICWGRSCNHKLVNLFSYTTSSVSEIRQVSCKRIVFLPRLNDVSGSLWLELRSL